MKLVLALTVIIAVLFVYETVGVPCNVSSHAAHFMEHAANLKGINLVHGVAGSDSDRGPPPGPPRNLTSHV